MKKFKMKLVILLEKLQVNQVLREDCYQMTIFVENSSLVMLRLLKCY